MYTCIAAENTFVRKCAYY